MSRAGIIALMRMLCFWLCSCLLAIGGASDDFIAAAKASHGDAGERAATFLVEHMPAADRESLSKEFLVENLELALKARESFPWAKQVPEEIFLNDVLPYAVFDETRDSWRADFLAKAEPLVKEASTASEAAQILNREFFKLINVHYNTGRKRPNQSPEESIAQSIATCTGLSIILVDACRAVGIPARAVGTPLWSNGRGNHTWVEIWDGGWHFTGADEFDAQGLNRGWFTGDAAQAKAEVPENAIYATSWKREGLAFPMVWAPGSEAVAAVNVTDRYTADTAEPAHLLGVRLFAGDERIAAKGRLLNAAGEPVADFETKAGTSDLNDMPRLPVEPGGSYRLRFDLAAGFFESETFMADAGESTIDLRRSELKPAPDEAEPPASLSKADAAAAITRIHQELVERQMDVRRAEMEARSITLGDKTLKWLEKSFGSAPEDGHSLWISLHGGGGTTAEVNDQQWRNQIGLYQPEEGIYLAPRAPHDAWNMWHEIHVDPLVSRLIENHIALRGVNPDRVYLMGYSAGGDGVWQLAPRMADRFAAASMMAGHPNEASLLGLRNLPFAIFMGGADAAYDRNQIAALKTTELAQLQKDDPDGYRHLSRIYEGLPHWMNGKDAEALPWMAEFTRNPWPRKIVWVQDDVTHDRFYWLRLPPASPKSAGQKIIATAEGRTIRLEGDVPAGIELLLSDELLDLDALLKVIVNGGPAREFQPVRSPHVIRAALEERLDPRAAPTAVIRLD